MLITNIHLENGEDCTDIRVSDGVLKQSRRGFRRCREKRLSTGPAA